MAALILAIWMALAGAPAQAASVPPSMHAAPASAHARVEFVAAPGLEEKARELQPFTEAALAQAAADLAGLPQIDHVEVRLVVHSSEMTAAAPPGQGAPEWAAGVAFPESGVVVIAARDASGQLIDMRATLTHELAHMALERALGSAHVPRWLHEGFAFRHSSDWTMERTETLAGAFWRGGLTPIGALEYAFPAGHDGVSVAYAESYDFVNYLAHRGRWDDGVDANDPAAFRQFLSELAGGASVDAAALKAFGRTLPQLEGEWTEGLRTRYLWYPGAAIVGLFWIVLLVLAVFGWRRRRRAMLSRLVQMGRDERAAEALAMIRAAALASLQAAVNEGIAPAAPAAPTSLPN